eukprot:CAMPEP_0117805622 /NCGR_PEP_ID=MMETSP0948-20121206/17985_1 /TAXON_ID=44440 /ORGANISM="Chattonella subsalsa, Strain CCMP2191" /LENGTH=100 /DNA_ID=CAMNT_0005639747 /DNA_START=93 /DNA_END=395 /DNA_ORIENTATION=-
MAGYSCSSLIEKYCCGCCTSSKYSTEDNNPPENHKYDFFQASESPSSVKSENSAGSLFESDDPTEVILLGNDVHTPPEMLDAESLPSSPAEMINFDGNVS